MDTNNERTNQGRNTRKSRVILDLQRHTDDEPSADERLLEENVPNAINCAFVGFGGGGGKIQS